MQQGAHHSSVLEGNKHFEEANRLLLAAKHINPTEQMIQIGYGQLQCAKVSLAVHRLPSSAGLPGSSLH